MDMHWMFAQNLKERIALKSVSSEENRGKKCQKKEKRKKLCQNNVWTQMFSNRDCVMEEYLLASIFKSFLYPLPFSDLLYYSFQCSVPLCFVNFSFHVKGKFLCVQK